MSAPSPSSPEAPPDIQANLRRTFIKSLATPLLVLAFFLIAPHWLNQKLENSIESGINSSTRLSPAQKAEQIAALRKLDLGDVCRGGVPGLEALRANLEQAGVCGNFARLRWGLLLSAALTLILLGSISAMVVLNRGARQSRARLIYGYRLSWRIGMIASFAQVVLLIPLLAYSTFELTVLISDRYFPKLLIIIVLGGLIALWRSAAILLKNVPLEFEEVFSREVTPQDAPELWEAVRATAARLNTAPPDRIVIGMQFNFYVTELAVLHTNGRAEGRTLFLSQPLLKHLSTDEVVAIIGHELGHFLGEDTRMTREFYPLRLKAHATMFTLAQSGFVGLTSLWFLEFFSWCFGATEQEASRQRELEADRKAAEVTSPQTAARALVRFHAVHAAFQVGLTDRLGSGAENPLDFPLLPVIREKLVPKAEFWTELFEQKSPHPLDSHPALHIRLESLGQTMTTVDAQTVAAAEVDSAYSRWFALRDALFTEITQKAGEAVGRMRSQVQLAQADATTEAGRQLLESHFPEVTWREKPGRLWFMVITLGIIVIASLAAAILVPLPWLQIVCGLAAVLLAMCTVTLWRRRHRARIVLNSESIWHSGWDRPLKFEDVATITLNQQSGMSLTFILKTKQSPFWKYGMMRYPRKSVALELSGLDRKGLEVAETIHRYLTRQIAPAPTP